MEDILDPLILSPTSGRWQKVATIIASLLALEVGAKLPSVCNPLHGARSKWAHLCRGLDPRVHAEAKAA